jgi:lipopolysaccharide biosynthesis glycosyltransferase
MNLIYACVFHQQNYITLLKLLIKSLHVRGNLNQETTDILIMTSPNFLPLIQKELSEFDFNLNYYILDLHTLFEAGCARLSIFNYEKINQYEKILYLDTDILINNDINEIFNIEISSDKIYALEEGILNSGFYGSIFFDFSKYNKNQTAFTSGILFFKNNIAIIELFNKITGHIQSYIYEQKNPIPDCLDQPFIVYNSVIENKYNNKILIKYVENNPLVVNSEKIIYHFPGGPGHFDSKQHKMNFFWNKIHNFWTLPKSQEIKDDLIVINKSYSWENSNITFLKKGEMNAFGRGTYEKESDKIFIAHFGGRIHKITFNDDFTEFKSIRFDDNQVVLGKIIK